MWMSSEVKSLVLHFDSVLAPLKQVGPSVMLHCKRYHVLPGDILCKRYPTSTGTVSLELPNYALCKLPAAAKSLDAYVQNNFFYFVNELLDNAHPLYRLTLSEALRHQSRVSAVLCEMYRKLILIMMTGQHAR
jgi:hypothetical protein